METCPYKKKNKGYHTLSNKQLNGQVKTMTIVIYVITTGRPLAYTATNLLGKLINNDYDYDWADTSPPVSLRWNTMT